MQEDDRKAQGNSKLMEINQKLQAEAQAQKVVLLQEIENLKREKAKAEDGLIDL